MCREKQFGNQLMKLLEDEICTKNDQITNLLKKLLPLRLRFSYITMKKQKSSNLLNITCNQTTQALGASLRLEILY